MRKFLLGFVVWILTLPAGAFAAAWLGWLPTNANATPSTLEKAFAHVALDRAAARHAPHLVNPVASAEENLMAGMRLFRGDCAGCHGDPNNAARREAENFLYPGPPVFALILRASLTISCSGLLKAACGTRGCSSGTGNSAKTHLEEIFRMKRFGGR
jgi:hypothetical protein